MGVLFQTAQAKLASLLWYLGESLLFCLWSAGNRWPRAVGWAWTMVHRPEWQKNIGLSAILVPASFVSLHFATKRYGGGLEVILLQTAVFDAATFGFNRQKVFKNRGATKSGSKSVVIGVVCFLYHKALASILMLVFGLNVMEVKAALTGVGVVENPVLFAARDLWVFTPSGHRESSAALERLEMARAAVAGHLLRFKTGA